MAIVILDFDHTLGDFDGILQAVCYLAHCLEENPHAKWRDLEVNWDV